MEEYTEEMSGQGKLFKVPETETNNNSTSNGHVTPRCDLIPGPMTSPLHHGSDLSSSSGESDDDENSENDDSEIDAAPDGGWGWVVCFGSFIINLIMDGSIFSFGVLMLALVSDLDQDESTTSWVGSVQFGVLMMMGPATSVMLQRYTFRQVVVAGAFLTAGSFFVSVFAPNVYILIFTFGVVGGIGFGMVFQPSVIILVPYFNKKRAFATGIATSGSGLGAFVFGWIYAELLEEYNWRGTMLILTGITLHIVICGLLFRPLERSKKRSNKNRLEKKDYVTEGAHKANKLMISRDGRTEVIPEISITRISSKDSMYQKILDEQNLNDPQTVFEKDTYDPVEGYLQRHLRTIEPYREEDQEINLNYDGNLNKGDSNGDSIPCLQDKGEPGDIINSNKHKDSQITEKESPDLQRRPFWQVVEPSTGKYTVNRIFSSDDHVNNIKARPSAGGDSNSQHYGNTAESSSNDRLHSCRKDHTPQTPSPLIGGNLDKSQAVSLYGINGYSSNHPHHRHQHLRQRHPQQQHHHEEHNHHHSSYYELGGSRFRIDEGLTNGHAGRKSRGSSTYLATYQYYGSMASFAAAITYRGSVENVDINSQGCCSIFRQQLGRCFPTRLLHDPVFLMLLVVFTMWTGQSITLTYLPTYAVSLGIEPSQAAYLISIIGIANVLGRPLAGLITDCLSIPCVSLYLCALALAALTNFVIPLCSTFAMLATAAAIFGFCMAVACSLRTIVLVDQLGPDVLAESFGIVTLCQGIGFIVVPPMAGSMIERFKTCQPTFWMSGGMYAISAIMTLGVICLSAWRKRANTKPVTTLTV